MYLPFYKFIKYKNKKSSQKIELSGKNINSFKQKSLKEINIYALSFCLRD